MTSRAALQATVEAEPVTAIIQHEVRPDSVQRYERWLERIMPAAAAFPGHAGVRVVRPPAHGPRRYSVAVRFDSLAEAQAWFGSDARRALLREAADLWFAAKPSAPCPGWNCGSHRRRGALRPHAGRCSWSRCLRSIR
jgi:antibiotic biosynthesis monooxygenase (ABM) superfamily enzyme